MEKRILKSPQYLDEFVTAFNAKFPNHAPFMEVREVQNGRSWAFYLYRQRSFLISSLKSGERVTLYCTETIENPDSVSPSHSILSDGSYVFPVDVAFNHNTFLGLTGDIAAYNRSMATVERFGCCHRFIRCSDIRKCLIEDEFFSLGCYYRENLEAGHIFYGVNKNID